VSLIKDNSKNKFVFFGVLVAFALVGLSILNIQKGDNKQVKKSKDVIINDASKKDDLANKQIVIEASEYKYSVSSLNFKKGEKVKLTLKNVGNAPHDFVIDEINVRTKTIMPGESTSLEFTPEVIGKFKFYCSIGNHRQLGMEGEVSVE